LDKVIITKLDEYSEGRMMLNDIICRVIYMQAFIRNSLNLDYNFGQ